MMISINGIVQGVGFRPFIHKLAKESMLYGWVKNTSSGVIIEIEGSMDKLKAFIKSIEEDSPKLAVIENMLYEIYDELKNYNSFSIIKSSGNEEERFTLISPDVCTCEDCQRELFDPNNRRFKYPFINCTNCGPRFTIIKDIPYDRDKTTMKEFRMCRECQEEYEDINNRRYHAQPDCCYECGPGLIFLDGTGKKAQGDPVEIARAYIKEGKIVAIKGIGGFHLACNAENTDAINEVRKRKQRDEKPFAIMCRDTASAEKWCVIGGEEKKLLESYRRPIVLLEKKDSSLDTVSPDNNYLGVMLPYTPIHFLLLEKDIDTIVMTSGNISDTPIIYKNEEALEKLKGIADGFLINDREIHVRCDDSLMRVFEGREYPLRRSRGYVPFPIRLNVKIQNILALGAEQKASFALSKGEYVFQSQHIGDLKNIETLYNYESMIEHFKRMFDIEPDLLACDLHPDYMSTEYGVNKAGKTKKPLHLIQHHHAHMASCMADNNLFNDVAGIIWDGTGYGDNGEIWGGEFLIGGYKSYTRAASIRPIALPGGDKAVKEIYRIAYGLLYDVYGFIPEEFRRQNSEYIEKMLQTGINCPRASSAGRLFDGICALIDLKSVATYEGQGAVALEGIGAKSKTDEHYKIEIYKSNEMDIFDWRPMVKQIVYDIKNKTEKSMICAKFMNTLIRMTGIILNSSTLMKGINEVVLSGGVFQNIYLLNGVKKELEGNGFKVYVHNRASANDEGISLGQILIAANGGSIKCV